MFDNPLFFLILISVLSAISDWIGKRRKAARMQEMEDSAPIDLSEEAPPAEAVREERRRSVHQEQEDWEERLRRMIGADEAHSPAKQETRPISQSQPSDDYELEPPPPPPVYRPESKPVQQAAMPIPSAPIPKTKISLSKSAPAMQTLRSRRARGPRVINFRSRDAIRKSIVAAVVLGPPKGSGEKTDLIQL